MGHIKQILRPENRAILQIFAPRSAAFLRSLTFEALDIPHTCSHNILTWSPDYDQKELQEIQDEWKDLIDLLEDLLDEFLAAILSSDMPFSQFVQEVWTKRMEGVLATSLGSDEVCQMREIGVVLEEIE
ncbi:hypothetical protein N7493_009829 [Penicillium malachiteum]|uniref:Uncharacterized protein n=1 Tax=Penicillium malachiteum TaxID=1324776 RepID=A0AAD6MS34_9EURO|nr:hypothetical protein N7493_009829 [Penicillium malachiteum]